MSKTVPEEGRLVYETTSLPSAAEFRGTRIVRRYPLFRLRPLNRSPAFLKAVLLFSDKQATMSETVAQGDQHTSTDSNEGVFEERQTADVSKTIADAEPDARKETAETPKPKIKRKSKAKVKATPNVKAQAGPDQEYSPCKHSRFSALAWRALQPMKPMTSLRNSAAQSSKAKRTSKRSSRSSSGTTGSISLSPVGSGVPVREDAMQFVSPTATESRDEMAKLLNPFPRVPKYVGNPPWLTRYHPDLIQHPTRNSAAKKSN